MLLDLIAMLQLSLLFIIFLGAYLLLLEYLMPSQPTNIF